MAYVAVSKLLLPVGIMGIMFSAMFAAAMSTLNAEYNIMSAVFTTDVYKRLINPAANKKRLLLVARFSTTVIGAIMILGAIYVKYFGGAFEANKLFTGIVAIPLGIPFIFGIVCKKPNVWAAYSSIVIGVLAGIVFNALPVISWEWATLTEIAICLVCYFVPPYLINRKKNKKNPAVERFFERLQTPIREEDKPVITPEYKRVLITLFPMSIMITGALFIGMSIPSLHLYSGKLTFFSGCFCLLCACGIWLYFRKRK
jgi:uncharacterized sodium:solute symporter family permease YidK